MKYILFTFTLFLILTISFSNAFQNEERKDDDKVNTAVSDMLNKPSQSLYDQIVSRLFHHSDNFIEIEKSIEQFGHFWNSLKKAAERHQQKKQNTLESSTTTSNSDDSSNNEQEQQQIVQDHKHNQEKKQRHSSSHHKGFHYNSKNKNDKVEIDINAKATLGKKPISDGLNNWLNKNGNAAAQIVESIIESVVDTNTANAVTATTSTCNGGVIQSSSQSTNTCNGGETCYINQMICNGQTINVDSNTHVNDYDIKSCQILSMYCPKTSEPLKYINFKQQYGLNQCFLNSTQCPTNYLSDCTIDVLCDKYTSFNKEKYGYYCVNNQLVCNNDIIPYDKYSQYSDDIKNGNCKVQPIACTSNNNDQCLKLSLNCPTPNNCTLNQQELSCSDYFCTRSLNTTSCDCPVDFSGSNCQKSQPFSCDIIINSPSTTCRGSDFLLSPKPCFTFSYSDKVSYSYSLRCSFLTTPKPTKHAFKYWVDTPKFKISNPVDWELLSENINLYRIFNNSLLNIIKLDNEQIAGKSPIFVNTTLSNIPSQYWIAKRVYTEVSLSTESPQTSKNGVVENTLTVAKFYMYARDYPDRENSNNGIADWKLALFIILGVACAIGLAIAAFIFYRMKLKVN